MKVTELFYSVQGEGSRLGLPAFFIRLSGCNKSCDFCDSKYAQTESTEMTIHQILEEIDKIKNNYQHNIVITGGEPLLQQQELTELLRYLHNYYIEIETNGSIKPNEELTEIVDQWNISPKNETDTLSLPNKFPLYTSCIKLVCNLNNLKSWTEIALRLCETYPLPRSFITLMPQCISIDEQTKILPQLIETSKITGFRVSPRLQILSYGNKRGV